VALEFSGDPAEVWRRASTIAEIPNYWHGTRSLSVLGETNGVTRAKVKFAFGGSGEAEISAVEEGRILTIDYKSGPFTGRQTVQVNDGRAVAMWDVKFRGIYALTSKWSDRHFRTGTARALERLVYGNRGREEAKSSASRPTTNG